MSQCSQTYEQAQVIETGGMCNYFGEKYTKENYPYVMAFNPYHPSVPVMRWVINYGYKYEEYDHEETDFTRYESDDGEYIPVGKCRKCKKTITPYSEKFYRKVYEYNHWNNFEFSQKIGYCKECSLALAVIINRGWNPAFAVADRYETVEDDANREIKIMADGSIVEEMSISEKFRKRR